MPLFFSEHKLVDFDNWFATFQNNEVRLELEEKTGVKAIRVMRFPDDPNHSIVAFEAPNRAAMSQIESDPRLQERFTDKSIFVEPPRIIGGYLVTDLENFTPGSDPSVKPFWIKHDLWHNGINKHRRDQCSACWNGISIYHLCPHAFNVSRIWIQNFNGSISLLDSRCL